MNRIDNKIPIPNSKSSIQETNTTRPSWDNLFKNLSASKETKSFSYTQPLVKGTRSSLKQTTLPFAVNFSWMQQLPFFLLLATFVQGILSLLLNKKLKPQTQNNKPLKAPHPCQSKPAHQSLHSQNALSSKKPKLGDDAQFLIAECRTFLDEFIPSDNGSLSKKDAEKILSLAKRLEAMKTSYGELLDNHINFKEAYRQLNPLAESISSHSPTHATRETIREIKGDGNCFYRALMVGILLKIVETKTEQERLEHFSNLSKKFNPIKKETNTFLKTLESAAQGKSWKTKEDLEASLMDTSFDKDIVRSFKELIAKHIESNKKTYEPFAPNLAEEITKIRKDRVYAEGIAISGAEKALKISFQIAQESVDGQEIRYDSQESDKRLMPVLLFKNTHYDLIERS